MGTFRPSTRAESGPHFTLDEEKIRAEEQFDGHWLLRTNLADEPGMIAMPYKPLWMVEDVFWTMKSTLETRPIYPKRVESIRGHVFCSFLAVMLRRALDLRSQEKPRSGSGRKSFLDSRSYTK